MIYNYFKFRLSTMIQRQLLNRQDTLEYLAHLALPYKLYEHDAVLNMKEMAEKVKLEHAPLVKNLVYSDSKAKCLYYVIVLDDGKVDKSNSSIIQLCGRRAESTPTMSDSPRKRI